MATTRKARRPIPWPLRSLRFRPELGPDRRLLAPPLSDAHQLVGAAFEHLLRLEMQRLNPMAEPGQCLAAYAVDAAEYAARNAGKVMLGTALVQAPSRRGLATVYSQSKRPHEDVRQIQEALQFAQRQGQEYLQKGLITRDLLRACWILAKMIGAFRASRRALSHCVLIPYDLGGVDESGLDDISAMFSLVDRQSFRASQTCLLQPAFRLDAQVGVNQPDFVIDDMIVDVKCTARKSLDRRDIDQLLRYYALSKLEGLASEAPLVEINRLAIYYARFAQWFTIDVRTDFPPERVAKFLQWFEGQRCPGADLQESFQ
jgi:hypothetical protein